MNDRDPAPESEAVPNQSSATRSSYAISPVLLICVPEFVIVKTVSAVAKATIISSPGEPKLSW